MEYPGRNVGIWDAVRGSHTATQIPTFCGSGLPGSYPTHSRLPITRTYTLCSSYHSPEPPS